MREFLKFGPLPTDVEVVKKLLLVAVALGAGGIVVGASPDAVVDAAQDVVGAVTDESGELSAEQTFERELADTLGGTLSLMSEPVCDAQAIASTGDGELEFSSLECRAATVEYGVVEVSAQLRGERTVLVLTDADTTQHIGVLDDAGIAEWLPLAPSPTR